MGAYTCYKFCEPTELFEQVFKFAVKLNSPCLDKPKSPMSHGLMQA
jgi:hypothetical protein